MAGNKEEVEVVINGTKASASLKEMRAAIAVMNKELKDLPRNSQEFADKKAEIAKLKSEFKDTQKEVKGVNKAQVDLIDTFGDFIPFSGQIQAMRGNFDKWTGGVKGVTQGMRLLKVAMAATGIGALVVMLGSLVSYLTSTQAGMDKVTAVTRPLMAIFDKLIGVAQELGGSVFKGLAMIMNGDIKEGLNALKDGAVDAVKGVGTAVTEGAKAGTQLDQMQKQIEKTEIELIKNRARLNDEYAKAKEIAQDQSKTEAERLAAARKAQEAQNDLLKMEQQFLDLKIEKMELSHTLNDTSREDEKELSELIAQRTQMEADAARKRASVRSLENSIVKELAAERDKIRQEEIKKEDERQKKILDARKNLDQASLNLQTKLQDLRLEAMEDGVEKELTTLTLQHSRKMAMLEMQKDDTLSNIAITEEEKINLLAGYREQQDILEAEYQQARKEAEEKQREEDFEVSLERLEEEEGMKKALLEEKYLNAQMAEGEHQRALLDLEKATTEARLALMEEAGQGETLQAQQLRNQLISIEQEKNAQIIAEQQKLEEQKRALQQATYDTARQFLDLNLAVIQQETDERTSAIDQRIEYLSRDEEAQERNASQIARLEREKTQVKREAAKKMLKVQIAQIIASGIQEVANIWAGASTLGPIAGPIVGAIQTALAVGRSVLAVRQARQQANSYADGGYTSALSIGGNGKLIDQTGHAVAGVVHDKEWVSPRWMNEDPRYADTIAWLESERTRRFAEGGYTTPASQNPAPNPQSPASDMQIEFVALRRDLQGYAARIDRWATTLKVNNDPRDIREGLNALNRISEDSDIR